MISQAFRDAAILEWSDGIIGEANHAVVLTQSHANPTPIAFAVPTHVLESTILMGCSVCLEYPSN